MFVRKEQRQTAGTRTSKLSTMNTVQQPPPSIRVDYLKRFQFLSEKVPAPRVLHPTIQVIPEVSWRSSEPQNPLRGPGARKSRPLAAP